MLRPLLIVLLGASLAANAWLALPPRASVAPTTRAPTPAATATAASTQRPPAPPAAAAANSAADPTAPRGFVWHSPVSDDDFRRLAGELRAAGFPPRLIATLVRDLYLQHALGRMRSADVPFWQQFSAERTKEVQATYRNLQSTLDNLLGPDARASLLLDPISRQRRYGALPDAKIDAIATIERDYTDMQQDIYRATDRTGFSTDAFRSQRDQTKLLNAEKLADLAKILTPAELADYELHNSETSSSLARALSGLDVTPEQFAALYPLRRAYDEANQPLNGVVPPEVLAQRSAAQTTYFDAARTLLPADTFYAFLKNSDSTYRQIAQLPNTTPAGAYEAWTLQQEFTQRMSQFRGTRPSAEQFQAVFADFNARLDRALGPEAAAAYRKTPRGRMFVAPQVRPSSLNTTTPPRN
jgi:hypothetical protein